MSNQLNKLLLAAVLLGASIDARAAAGNGIRLGGSEGRLHPFVELEGRYDSNAYVGTVGVAGASDFIIHVRPGVTLQVPGEMTSVDVAAKLDWAQYLGTSDARSKDLSKLYAEAMLGIGVNKKGVVSLEVDDTFRRSDRPQALSLGVGVISNYNALEVKVPIRPGGGALTISLNGGWALETYESLITSGCPGPDPLCSVSKLGYNELQAGAGVAWKFLPRTSALVEGSYFKRSPNDKAASGNQDPAGYRVDAGVTGLVTPHVAATLKAGYGATTGVAPTTSTFLATVEGEWMPTETATVKLGYTHDLGVDPGTQYTTNKVALSGRQLLAGRFLLGLTGSWDQLSYTGGSVSTNILQVSPSVGAEVTRWLKAELAYAYTDRASTSGSAIAATDYSKSEAWLKLTGTY